MQIDLFRATLRKGRRAVRKAPSVGQGRTVLLIFRERRCKLGRSMLRTKYAFAKAL